MLRLLDGFDGSDLTNWLTVTAETAIVPGRMGGGCLQLCSRGYGIFSAVQMLPSKFSRGSLGFAIRGAELAIMMFIGSQEQLRVTFGKTGRIDIRCFGQSYGQTGTAFSVSNWTYFEIVHDDDTLTIGRNGVSILQFHRLPTLIYDRLVLGIPENQLTPVYIDDLYFNDEPSMRGNLIVHRKADRVPHIPTEIHGVKKDDVVMGVNPETSKPWTFWDIMKLPEDASVLMSENQPNSSFHYNSTIMG